MAAENPRVAVVEKTKFVAKDRIELQVGGSEKFMISLRRAQDVLSQKKRRPESLEETLEAAVAIFNEKSDPLERAKRQLIKGMLNSPNQQLTEPCQLNSIQPTACSTQHSTSISGPGRITRAPLPALVRHKLNIKFQGQCAYQDQRGERCPQRRFLDIHHLKPVSEGGTNELENLELLCTGHHRVRHH